MERVVFRSLVKVGEEESVQAEVLAASSFLKFLVNKGFLMTISVFIQGRTLFLYYECMNDFISPSELLPDITSLLEARMDEGGSKHWTPMIDIFHFSEPLSPDQWRRTQPVQERVGRIARIKPSKLSSYIYYHYMLQEGHAGCDNKYCMIGLDANVIFYYEELPKTPEERLPSGNGRFSALPPDWPLIWQGLMEPHFIVWDDVEAEERQLRSCELIFGC